MLAIFAVFCLWLVLPVSAQNPSAIPSDNGIPGVFGTRSSHPLRPGLLMSGISNHAGWGSGLVQGGTVYEGAARNPVPIGDALVYEGEIFFAAGLGAGFDVSLDLPVYYEYLAGAGESPDTWGPGDASAFLKYGLPFDIPFVSLSVSVSGSAPTSPRDGTRMPKRLAYQPYSGRFPDRVSHSLGMEAPRAGAGAGISLDFSEAMNGPDIKLHANAEAERTLADDTRNPLGTLAASIACEAFLARFMRLELELRHQRLAVSPGTLGSPIGKTSTLGVGLGIRPGGGLTLRGGALVAPSAWNPYLPLAWRDGSGVEREMGYRPIPPLSAFFQIAWQGFPLERDMDHDGIPDGRDICPSVPEDRDGFQDDDGCPDPDNDQDGVLDAMDKCPYVPEDHDGFEDRDGCPELDNDRDGIPDPMDKCPNDPEDKDGFQDGDGCPDLDDDQDGIPDVLDKCPREAENRNGVEDEDGCPEADGDGDRIPDSRDKCPREAEIINFYQDEDGCPDEKPEPIRDAVLAGVVFIGNTAELDPASNLSLDGLAARMFAYPGTEIEIQGFLDDRAGPRSKALSRERAQAVAEYLVNRGVEARRLKPAGYGSANPLESNRTAKGRAANRRIQIHRLN
jgi:outer membrane protein OmpA-like peptidoglycan-associated protein